MLDLHPEVRAGLQPVRALSIDDDAESLEGLGLCLSGGGYRAMLFHVGALLRLNEAGLLRELDRVSSVSGASITAATLGLHWSGLDWCDRVARNLFGLLVDPIRELACHTIDFSSVLEGALLPFTSIGEQVADAYRDHLFLEATLQDLPAHPRFIINATNLESGALFRFSRRHAADWRVGRIDDPVIGLATAVAASSAFPPVLSPFELDLRGARWTTVPGNELVSAEYRSKIALSDGGVYDNLGLETVWKRCRTVLVSDAGGHISHDDHPARDWPRHTLRVLGVIDNQVRALRKRQLIASYEAGLRSGAYWGIRANMADYGLGDALWAAHEKTMRLAEISTRLAALDDLQQERLINWGYAICDTALRRWVRPDLLAPEEMPYPTAGIG